MRFHMVIGVLFMYSSGVDVNAKTHSTEAKVGWIQYGWWFSQRRMNLVQNQNKQSANY